MRAPATRLPSCGALLQIINAQRRVIARNLQAHVDVPGLSLWKDADEGNRYAGYREWIHANVRALTVNANITTRSLYDKLLAESQIDGALWFHIYNVEAWYTGPSGFYRADGSHVPSTWTHHITSAGTKQAGMRGGEASGLVMPTGNIHWPTQLAKLLKGVTS